MKNKSDDQDLSPDYPLLREIIDSSPDIPPRECSSPRHVDRSEGSSHLSPRTLEFPSPSSRCIGESSPAFRFRTPLKLTKSRSTQCVASINLSHTTRATSADDILKSRCHESCPAEPSMPNPPRVNPNVGNSSTRPVTEIEQVGFLGSTANSSNHFCRSDCPQLKTSMRKVYVVERRVRQQQHDDIIPKYQPKVISHLQKHLPWYSSTSEIALGPWASPGPDEVPYIDWFNEFRARCVHRPDRIAMAIRFGIFASVICGLCLVNIILEADVSPSYGHQTEGLGIWDWLHEKSIGLNSLIRQDQLFRSILLLVSSFGMDVVVILVFLQWCFIGSSSSLPIGYVCFYVLKYILGLICIFPYARGYVWDTPSIGGVRIKSLSVPYVGSADFFYSGHVGCCMLSALEHYSYRCYWGVCLSIAVAVLESFTMIVTRGHYTIDLISGVVFAHYIVYLTRKMARYIDQWLCLPPRPLVITRMAPEDRDMGSSGSPLVGSATLGRSHTLENV